ncbi:hypothetical protein RUM43_008784 [Polyplax serrata]|uniref:Regucalcin n=1 Tax=Polyplax serrata TaxID=468196 RepID=A0AAN8NUV9_POLSC
MNRIFYESNSNINIESVTEPVEHGEGPFWDAEKKVLYFVDLLKGGINKYDPNTGDLQRLDLDGPVTLIVPAKGETEQFVIGHGRDIVALKWNGTSDKPSSLSVLASVDKNKPENRFNDGKADAKGRLWAGTMGPEKPELLYNEGSLFSFEWTNNFSPVNHLSPVSISNGLAWNENNDKMYYIDSPTRKINVFDFNLSEGSISNQTDLFSLDSNNLPGVPDGMTIDDKGNLWVALYNGSSVINIDTNTGRLINKIKLPVTFPTSCVFGGDDFQDLYVTTSRKDLTEKEVSQEPLAGSLLRITGLEVRGQGTFNKFAMRKVVHH